MPNIWTSSVPWLELISKIAILFLYAICFLISYRFKSVNHFLTRICTVCEGGIFNICFISHFICVYTSMFFLQNGTACQKPLQLRCYEFRVSGILLFSSVYFCGRWNLFFFVPSFLIIKLIVQIALSSCINPLSPENHLFSLLRSIRLNFTKYLSTTAVSRQGIRNYKILKEVSLPLVG